MIDLSGLFRIIWRRKGTIALVVVATVALTGTWLHFATPIYTASSSILLDTREQHITNVKEVVSELSVSSSVIAGEVSVVMSNLLVGKVVDQLHLVDDPEFDPWIPRAPSYADQAKDLLRRAFAAVGIADLWPLEADDRSRQPAASKKAEARRVVIEAVQNHLSVRQSGIAYVIEVSFSSPDPLTASRVANAVAQRYIQDQIDGSREATRRAAVWLGERIEGLRVQVETAEVAVVKLRAQQAREEGGGVDVVTQQLKELNSALVTASAARAAADAQYRQVANLLETGGVEAASRVVSSPLILTLSQQKAELERNLAELSKRYGAAHPEVVKVKAGIGDVERALELEVQKAQATMRNDLAVAVKRETQLTSEVETAQARLTKLAESSVQLRQLERSAAATASVYESFLARYKETSQQADLERAGARLISVAEPPRAPSHPRKKLILALAGIAGGVLGLGLAFGLELFSTVFHTPDELHARTGLPVLAVLPAVRRRTNKRWLVRQLVARPTTRFIEAARDLRTSLALLQGDVTPQVIMVTSALPGEGKSTTSITLAYLQHVAGHRSVIIDCNLRRPSLAKMFGADDAPTIEPYLRGEASIEDIVSIDPATGLHLIAAAPRKSVEDEWLHSSRLGELIEVLRDRYDFVILDAEATSSTSDSLLLAQRADAVLVVVRSGRTSASAVLHSLDRLEVSHCQIAGTVLSQAPANVRTDSLRGGRRFG
ncbi:Wzz/FepE/Etk N-terminal domain-containing protein [Consotaella salsifontis]|nr:Wzz/FepE/Etk N-terminal domain-containing protein [Consotaella salsifontis]